MTSRTRCERDGTWIEKDYLEAIPERQRFCRERPARLSVRELRLLVARSEYEAAFRLFERSEASAAKSSASAQYFAEYCWWKLGQSWRASERLRPAAVSGLTLSKDWESPEELLRRIKDYEHSRPPLRRTYRDGKGREIVRIFVASADWSAEFESRLADMVTQGAALFADRDFPRSLPIDVCVVGEIEEFDAIVEARFGRSHARWVFATGASGLVAICERYRDGHRDFSLGEPESLSTLAHEYFHALVRGHYGVSFVAEAPDRWNEGSARVFAQPYHESEFRRSETVVRDTIAHGEPPSLRHLARSLYEERIHVGYAFSHVFVRWLLAGQDMRGLRRLLDLAEETGGLGDAVRSETGRGLADHYETFLASNASETQ